MAISVIDGAMELAAVSTATSSPANCRTIPEVIKSLTDEEREFWNNLAPMVIDPEQLEYLRTTRNGWGPR